MSIRSGVSGPPSDPTAVLLACLNGEQLRHHTCQHCGREYVTVGEQNRPSRLGGWWEGRDGCPPCWLGGADGSFLQTRWAYIDEMHA